MDVEELWLSVLRAWDSIPWMSPSLFNQSPTKGNLNCFYSLQNILHLQETGLQ